jgi:hypothetical protein
LFDKEKERLSHYCGMFIVPQSAKVAETCLDMKLTTRKLNIFRMAPRFNAGTA